MSLWKAYRNLAPNTRLGLGLGVLFWGAAGLYFSDAAGDRIGLTPTDADREALDRMTPKIHVVDRPDRR